MSHSIQVLRRSPAKPQPVNEVLSLHGKINVAPPLNTLIADLYDMHRKTIASMLPIRQRCNVPTPIRNIERLVKTDMSRAKFDGMSHQEASIFYAEDASKLGIRNPWSVPFILSKRITLDHPSFPNGHAFIWEQVDGFRYCVLQTQSEFYWLVTNRQIMSNMSFALNLKYNCNLHIGIDEAERIFHNTGASVAANRGIFTRAADYYVAPNRLPFVDFIAAQVPELRNLPASLINEELERININTSMLAPSVQRAIEMAYKIYDLTDPLKNYVGDFSDPTLDCL